MKIQLYTCENGVKLFKLGYPFGAWGGDSESYKKDLKNFVIFVGENDIKVDGDGYTVVANAKSVEIIG